MTSLDLLVPRSLAVDACSLLLHDQEEAGLQRKGHSQGQLLHHTLDTLAVEEDNPVEEDTTCPLDRTNNMNGEKCTPC